MYNEVNDFLINFLVHLQAKQIYRIPIWQNILKQSDHWRKLECEGCTMNDKMTIWCLTANCLKLITKNWLNYGPHEAPRSSKPITFSVYKCTFVKFIYSEKATKSLRNLHLFFIKLERAWFLVHIITFYNQHFFSWYFEMNKILTLEFLSIVWNTLVSSMEWHLFDLWVQVNAVQEISLRVRSWFLVLSRKFFSVIAPDFTQCNFCFLQLSLWFS